MNISSLDSNNPTIAYNNFNGATIKKTEITYRSDAGRVLSLFKYRKNVIDSYAEDFCCGAYDLII